MVQNLCGISPVGLVLYHVSPPRPDRPCLSYTYTHTYNWFVYLFSLDGKGSWSLRLFILLVDVRGVVVGFRR